MPVNKKSLSEKITELINPNPVWEDPENDISETSAKVVENIPEDFEDDCSPNTTSLKLSQCAFLDENDTKYSGKRVSRRSLGDLVKGPSFQDSYKNLELSDDESIKSNQSQELSEASGSEEDEVNDGSEGDGSEDGEAESGETDDKSDDDDTDEEPSLDKSEGNEHPQLGNFSFRQIIGSSSSDEVEKGNAVRAQIRLWDNLLEARIQLQKCLVASNSLPQHNSFNAFREVGGSEFKKQISQCKKEGICLLEKLLELQKKMLLSFPETKEMYSGKTGDALDDNEEIPSSDEEDGDSKTDDTQEDEAPMKKKLKLSDISESISQQHDEFRNYRNSTLEKWYNRSKITSSTLKSSNFSAFDMSVVKQIDHILSDRASLIKRTQRKRSEIHVLGQPVQIEEDESTDKEQEVKPKEDYDVELYDDDDFYHKLLRDLIERKAADVTDPVQLGRQWTELQKLRKKLKKKVDTKASKGRKIRYVIHSKLVNFMAPIPNNWSDTAMDDLFRSLFGKAE